MANLNKNLICFQIDRIAIHSVEHVFEKQRRFFTVHTDVKETVEILQLKCHLIIIHKAFSWCVWKPVKSLKIIMLITIPLLLSYICTVASQYYIRVIMKTEEREIWEQANNDFVQVFTTILYIFIRSQVWVRFSAVYDTVSCFSVQGYFLTSLHMLLDWYESLWVVQCRLLHYFVVFITFTPSRA